MFDKTVRDYVRGWVSHHAGTDDEDAIETIVGWICEDMIRRPDVALTPWRKKALDEALGASHLDSARTAEEVTTEVLKEHVSDDCAELFGRPLAEIVLSEHSGLNTWSIGADEPLPKSLAEAYEHLIRREFRIRPDQLLEVKRQCRKAESMLA